MILVTGATGNIGRHVLKQLLEHGAPVRVMARNPDAVQTTAHVVRGDFEDPVSLAAATTGVEAVFLVTAPRRPVVDHDVAMVEAAGAAGAKRIVKLSAMGTGAWHVRTEAVTRAGGPEWTVLKPSGFASNLAGFAALVKAGQPVPDWGGPGRLGVIDPRDVAAVAVQALLTPDHAGRTYTLTGPELLTFADQLAVLGSVLDRRIDPLPVSVDEAGRMMRDNGMHPDSVDMAVAGIRAASEDAYAVLTGTVAEVTGRAPNSFEAWARDHRDLFG